MALVISKIRCNNPNYKGGKNANGKSRQNSSIANANHLIYIATRPGVALDMDLDYFNGKTIYEEYSSMDSDDTYKTHGLFGNVENINNIKKLSQYIYNITNNGKSIFKGIISLKEEDAVDLGYTNRKSWEILMKKEIPDIAQELGIPFSEMKYVAAVHMESGHPHLHYMVWSNNNNHIIKPFIKKEQQINILKTLTKDIGKERLQQLTLTKTAARDYMLDFNKKNLVNLTDVLLDIKKMEHTVFHSKIPDKMLTQDFHTLCLKLNEICNFLPTHGRITYQLVSPEVKKQVDALTEELLQMPPMKREYLRFLDNAQKLAQVYRSDPQKAEEAKKNADRDIQKRLGNQILTSAKNFKKNMNLLEYELRKLEIETENRAKFEAYSHLKQQQLLQSFGTKLFNNLFQTINFSQHDTYEELKQYRSKSKQAKKEITREQN